MAYCIDTVTMIVCLLKTIVMDAVDPSQDISSRYEIYDGMVIVIQPSRPATVLVMIICKCVIKEQT